MNRSAEFLSALDGIKNASPQARARIKKSLLDYLAVTVAGARFQAEKLERYFAFAMPEEGEFTAVGTGKKLVMKEAVFLNGLNGHALDFDDGTNAGIIHLGAPIFSLLLPLAQRYGLSSDEMLGAAIVGYEASFTMAVSIQPGHKALGYHATGTCGTLGAALAASYMLDFTKEERARAFAAACAASSGVLKVLDDGSELKPYNAAKTALLALTALGTAKAGFAGSPDPLGGNRGFFKMMTGKEDIELKPVLLGGTYAVEKSYTKPYASCRYTHPAVEAAIALRNGYGIQKEDVQSIEVVTYDLALSGHDHTEIPGPYSAKMSIPYSTAAALIYGKAGLAEFEEEVVKDPAVAELTRKVRVRADDELSAAFPKKQTATVTVKTRKDSFSFTVDYPKGEPENPFGEEEFLERYLDLMRYGGVPGERAMRAYDAVNLGLPVRKILENL